MANQIAAGEVIENPASVVKELVENSIDADARKITVLTEGASSDLIRVIDDGIGMSADDALRSLERHATSKIQVPDDLNNIATLGFRGEALPSIASVSRMTLVTKERGAVAGTEVVAIPDESLKQKPIGSPEGTKIEVRDLFFNTPARRKFLKAQSTETARITELVTRLALCKPEVAFSLLRNGKQTRSFLARESLAERVREVVGQKFELREGDGELGPVQVTAWLTGPEQARVGARALHIMVNGRLVRDQGLMRAIWYAYDNTLDQGHYPIGVVALQIDPKYLDVNVHPQKTEVRFQDRGAVHGAVSRVIGTLVQKRASYLHQQGDAATQKPPETTLFPATPWSPPAVPHSSWPQAASQSGAPHLESAPAPHTAPPVGFDPATTPQPMASPGNQSGIAHFSNLRFLASAGHAWLVCEGPEGLVIIDQHAAHERVTFEKLRDSYRANKPSAQQLLVPEQVEVSARELDLLEQNREQLQAIGFDVEPFSTTTVTISSVPAPLSRADPRRLLDEVLAELSAMQTPLGGAMDRVLARLACHGSIRGGSRIAREEVEALLQELDATHLGGHCPHGRPVSLHLGWGEIERRLGRHK